MLLKNLSYKTRGKINLKNMTPEEKEVYSLLILQGDAGATPNELAKKIGTSRQAVFTKLKRLAKNGLLYKLNGRYFLIENITLANI